MIKHACLTYIEQSTLSENMNRVYFLGFFLEVAQNSKLIVEKMVNREEKR